jgi:hypothetical protein
VQLWSARRGTPARSCRILDQVFFVYMQRRVVELEFRAR